MLAGGQPSTELCASAGWSRPVPAACSFDLAQLGHGVLEFTASVPTRPAQTSPGAWFSLFPRLVGERAPSVRCDPGEPPALAAAGRRNRPRCPFPGKNLRSKLLCQVQ